MKTRGPESACERPVAIDHRTNSETFESGEAWQSTAPAAATGVAVHHRPIGARGQLRESPPASSRQQCSALDWAAMSAFVAMLAAAIGIVVGIGFVPYVSF